MGLSYVPEATGTPDRASASDSLMHRMSHACNCVYVCVCVCVCVCVYVCVCIIYIWCIHVTFCASMCVCVCVRARHSTHTRHAECRTPTIICVYIDTHRNTHTLTHTHTYVCVYVLCAQKVSRLQLCIYVHRGLFWHYTRSLLTWIRIYTHVHTNTHTHTHNIGR